jgi:hypothetical protein
MGLIYLIVLIVVGVFIARSGSTQLGANGIIEQWFILVEGAQGKGEHLNKEVSRILTELAVPYLKLGNKDVSLGRWGRTRKFLITDNDYLKGYRVFIGTNDYGRQLSVSWYLTLETNILTQMSAAAAKNFFYAIIFFPILLVAKVCGFKFYTIPERMDLFDQEELRAYITTVHGTVKTATEGLMKSLDLDFSKVDTKSKGFFNIS